MNLFPPFRLCAICILVAAGLTSSPAAQVPQRASASGVREKQRAKVREIMERSRGESRFPGAVAGVYFADGSSFAVAVGVADRERRTPMPESALLHAGSVGKTLFAALALQLVGEGRLAFDDKVSKYLGSEPWYSRIPNSDTVTVRMLMNHTSGIPEFGEAFMRALIADPGRKRSPLDGVKSVIDAKPFFPAGTAFAYSDVNFQLLQLVTERVTGRPAYAEIDRRLLRPLGLRAIVPSNRSPLRGLVPGYAGKDNFLGFDAALKNGRLVLEPSFEGGGGGFITNPRDLARWMWLFMEGKAFPPALLPEVRKGVPAGQLDLGENALSGLGVEIFQTPLGVGYGHGGFYPGYISGLLCYPERGFAIAIQVNSSARDALARPLRDVFYEAALALSE